MSEGTLALKRERGAVGPLVAVLSDERLAQLAAKGSTPAFTAIYKRHHQEIYAAVTQSLLRRIRGLFGSEGPR